MGAAIGQSQLRGGPQREYTFEVCKIKRRFEEIGTLCLPGIGEDVQENNRAALDKQMSLIEESWSLCDTLFDILNKEGA
jgi:hypothetical protein